MIHYITSVNQEILDGLKKLFKYKYSDDGGFLTIENDGHGSLKVVGKKHNLMQAEGAVILDKIRQYNFPSHWTNIVELVDSDNLCMVLDVNKESSEFKRVELKFKITLPQAKVEKIERIQNKKLWRVFHNEVQDVA